ncbi:MAG: tRNA pseudouridine(38-40) synthase TruA [Streptococcaceae bacterium]|jgi:tRNA pseudouridine38-40 synthase|nr:tRNA pseudouridine(38-40) synthase TruA [Streptococcaceae bacterium]
MRFKAVISYDGTDFTGFQRQNDTRTVQGELEKTLTRMNGGQMVQVQGSGRTDSGVHALGQVIHFDLPQGRPEEKLRFALDTQSPEDIAVHSIEKVPDDWHARYQPHEKTYEYHLEIGKPRSVFNRRFASYFPYPLDIEKMQKAIKYLEGTHDFTGFTATGGSVEDKVRTIYEASLRYDKDQEIIIFTFSGNGFLYKQIRNMVGTLIKIGNDRFPIERIEEILEKKDRQLAGPTAHPEGLFLKEVRYL